MLTNGPKRVMFELIYEPFKVNGAQVAQVLRVSLDGGSGLNHFQSVYSGNLVTIRSQWLPA